jgi:hypothetical protein
MNTRNVVCSPFVYVLLMVGFLLFSLGCPAAREKTPEHAAKAAPTPSLEPAAKPAVPKVVVAEKPSPNDTAALPPQIPTEPVSIANPPAALNMLENGGREQSGADDDSNLPSAASPASFVETSGSPIAAESPDGAADDRSNPLRPPASSARPDNPPSTRGRSGAGVELMVSPQSPAASTARQQSVAPAARPGTPDKPATKPPVTPTNKSAAAPVGKQKLPASPKELRPPLDLIGENGEFFVDWKKPQLALLITGKIEGYLEPCGCAGIERMKGGMGRRFSLFKQLRAKGWPVVGLDVGGLANGFGREAEIKLHTLVDGMRAMDYGAITLGETDLKLPAGELVAETTNQPGRFVSANVGLFGFDANMIEKTRIIAAGGMKIGVTGVLGNSCQKEIQNAEIEFTDPAEAIKKVLPELRQKSDLLVLLAHATVDESKELAKRFPEFNVVVTSGGNPIPPPEPQKIPGLKTTFVEVGTKGMCAIVLGFYDGKDNKDAKVLYQRVVLDSRQSFIDRDKQGVVSTDPPPPEIKNLMAAFQNQLKDIGFQGLGLRASPRPQKVDGGRFVGTDKCKDCHEKSYRVWKKSGHAKAYKTLEELDPPRNFDPECVSCHVVGWNPQRFFPYEGGYQNPEKTPHLRDVGCEDCHGPGEYHCKAEEGSNEAKMKKYREAAVVTKEYSEKEQCRTCHDGDNSPDFNFKKYWPYVEHYEND